MTSDPRVAFLSFSNFGSTPHPLSEKVRRAVELTQSRRPDLPVDGVFPFFHPERKFMDLGFHIYDVGFQSPNVDASRPMVFTTTLLLLVIVVCLNLFAIALRQRLRRTYTVAAV